MSWRSDSPKNFKGTFTADQYRRLDIDPQIGYDEVFLDLGPDPYDEGGPCRMFAEVWDAAIELEMGKVLLTLNDGRPRPVDPQTILYYR